MLMHILEMNDIKKSIKRKDIEEILIHAFVSGNEPIIRYLQEKWKAPAMSLEVACRCENVDAIKRKIDSKHIDDDDVRKTIDYYYINNVRNKEIWGELIKSEQANKTVETEFQRKLNTLEKLSIENILSYMKKMNKTELRESRLLLNYMGGGIVDEGVNKIAELLESNSNILSIDFSNNEIGKKGGEAIRNQQNSHFD